MTDEMMSLCGLMEKSADTDLLREMIGFAAERLSQHLCGDRAVRNRIIDADRIRSVHDSTWWLDASTVVPGG